MRSRSAPPEPPDVPGTLAEAAERLEREEHRVHVLVLVEVDCLHGKEERGGGGREASCDGAGGGVPAAVDAGGQRQSRLGCVCCLEALRLA